MTPAGHVHAEGFVAPPWGLMAGAGLRGLGREGGLGGQALPGHQHGGGAALPQGTQGSNRRRRIHGDSALQVSNLRGRWTVTVILIFNVVFITYSLCYSFGYLLKKVPIAESNLSDINKN